MKPGTPENPRLPPGQYEVAIFPRFGLSKFARRFPESPSRSEVRIAGDVEEEVVVDPLDALPRVEQISDFHCVTTWTHRALRWSGVRFSVFYENVVLPQARPLAGATFAIARGQDGARTIFRLEDLLAPDVLIADTLEGSALTVEHGAPLRLVAPAQYGYKSVKHLSSIEFCRDESGFRPSAFRFMDHLRARVAFEERGRGAPGWLLRLLYRPLVGPTVARFARAMKMHSKGTGR
ncbi:MAG: molybdopterin-dependent oxidoreductase [Thermoanaerobaculia bacterium]